MTEYSICLHIPILKFPDVSIAKHYSDLGFQVGDVVNIADLEWNEITEYSSGYKKIRKGIKCSFETMVTMRRYLTDDKVQIQLEIADKEKLPELARILEHNSTIHED